MENKLKLNVDDLSVDSFDAGEDDAFRRGTVRGHAWSESTCYERICECAPETEADVSCGTCSGHWDTCVPGCETYLNCYTHDGYPGC